MTIVEHVMQVIYKPHNYPPPICKTPQGSRNSFLRFDEETMRASFRRRQRHQMLCRPPRCISTRHFENTERKNVRKPIMLTNAPG